MEVTSGSTKIFSKPEWESEKTRYLCKQNGFGQWWPIMEFRTDINSSWGQIIIRDSNPFKTLNGAIKFVDKTKAWIEERDAKKAKKFLNSETMYGEK